MEGGEKLLKAIWSTFLYFVEHLWAPLMEEQRLDLGKKLTTCLTLHKCLSPFYTGALVSLFKLAINTCLNLSTGWHAFSGKLPELRPSFVHICHHIYEVSVIPQHLPVHLKAIKKTPTLAVVVVVAAAALVLLTTTKLVPKYFLWSNKIRNWLLLLYHAYLFVLMQDLSMGFFFL